MIKKVIKSILWRTGLWNRLNSILWKFESIEKHATLVYQRMNDDFKSFTTDQLISEEGKRSYKAQNDRWAIQSDKIYLFSQPVIIEPSQGLILTQDKIVIEESRIHDYIYPSVKVKFNKLSPFELIEEAYYFDGYVGSSYYHFFSEVLSSYLLFVKETGKKVPLIVHSKVATTRHFKYIVEAGLLQSDVYVLKDDQSVLVNKLYKASAAFTREYWTGLHDTLSNKQPLINSEKRIFINRVSKVGRTIANLEEVEKLLKKYEFKIYDTGSMSVEDQAKLFKSAAFIIGIHGAGLTNLIFAEHNVKVIEINPMYPSEDQLRPHYYWVGQCLNFEYQVYSPGKLSDKASFNVSCAELEQYILNMIK